jgi:hypothetical protein
MKKLKYLIEYFKKIGMHNELEEIICLIKEAGYNSPRAGKKRWSVKQKRGINCSSPKGFSQKQYCKRKARGGGYKS